MIIVSVVLKTTRKTEINITMVYLSILPIHFTHKGLLYLNTIGLGLSHEVTTLGRPYLGLT